MDCTSYANIEIIQFHTLWFSIFFQVSPFSEINQFSTKSIHNTEISGL